MVLEWHLFLRLSLGYVWKMLSFVGKHLKLLPKRCLFIFCIFNWNEKELNQQVCLIKYVENEICNSTSHTKKRGAKTFLKLWKFFTSYYISQIITFTTCGQTLTKIWKTKIGAKVWILLLLQIFIASTKDLNVLQISTEN